MSDVFHYHLYMVLVAQLFNYPSYDAMLKTEFIIKNYIHYFKFILPGLCWGWFKLVYFVVLFSLHIPWLLCIRQ